MLWHTIVYYSKFPRIFCHVSETDCYITFSSDLYVGGALLCSASTLFYWFTEACVAILAEWSDLLACATRDYTARHGLKAAPKAANANNCEDFGGLVY